ncbi:LysR substrate-binding domain-containing protein [Paracoccus sp. JM45]|uniref:LysR substrate-binding domain-containing protein n=1 Tax=Paracoccus sp. JM45 TaxID=2283626 RepID=UPI000E6C1F83|nr:LysR substrate-binding domain-containing protein [Paracoccus sp. JM45]RJE78800.1 LysR family transcriptional regulator [Paracoccus sp. JM45]
MTLEQLRIFIAVAERQHVTQAAHALNLTQSATSAALAALQDRHDVRLFDRVGRGIELTGLGRDFLAEARAVVARAAEAEAFLNTSTGLHHGSLCLVASQTVANYWLPSRMHRFHATYPGIQLTLQILNTEAACVALSEGKADLAFVEDIPAAPNLSLMWAATDQMVLVSHPQNIPRDIRNARWIMREQGSGTRRILEQALDKAKFDCATLDIALVLPSNEAVRAAAEAGAGIAALSYLVVADSLTANRLVQLPFALPARQFSILRPTQRHISRAAQAFLDTSNGGTGQGDL